MSRLKDESQEQYLARTKPYPDTPRPYKVYTALLTQSGTSAPVATVLENTLGFTPTYSRIDVGYYRINVAGLTTINSISKIEFLSDTYIYKVTCLPGLNYVDIFTFASNVLEDDISPDPTAPQIQIEIRVYP